MVQTAAALRQAAKAGAAVLRIHRVALGSVDATWARAGAAEGRAIGVVDGGMGDLVRAFGLGHAEGGWLGTEPGRPVIALSASGKGVAAATPAAHPQAPGSLGDVARPCYFLRVAPMPDVDRGIAPGGIATPSITPTSTVARLEDCHPAPALHPIGPTGP